MSTSGMGIQFDNVEASAAADATTTNVANGQTKTFSGSGVVATVQAWANGEPNYGWVLNHNSTATMSVYLSDNGTPTRRPKLTVTYQPPVAATSVTGAGVTVAVIDSGMLQDGGGSDRIKTTRDFTGGDSNPSGIGPVDGYGHGTHVAGLIGDNQAEALGVAPGVSYVSLRVLDSLGVGVWVPRAMSSTPFSGP